MQDHLESYISRFIQKGFAEGQSPSAGAASPFRLHFSNMDFFRFYTHVFRQPSYVLFELLC